LGTTSIAFLLWLTSLYAVDELRIKTIKDMNATEIFKTHWMGVDPFSETPIKLTGKDLIEIVDAALNIANSSNDIQNVSGLFDAKLMNRIRASQTDAEARRLIISAINKR
jgi:hypothetical protein